MIESTDRVGQEYGDSLNGLVPSSRQKRQGSLELDDGDSSFPSYAPPAKPSQKSLLFYLATLQAFVIIYRTETLLGTTLAICIGIAVSSSYHAKQKKLNPFEAAHIHNDYTDVTSKYDLTLGSIDHWCLRGDDNSCRCEDPLDPMSKRSSHKWEAQHTENIKVAQAALMKLMADGDNTWDNYANYMPSYDDMWIEAARDDDWIDGVGARFGDDDIGYDPFSNAWDKDEWDEDDLWDEDDFSNAWDKDEWDEDDGYGVPVEKVADKGAGRRGSEDTGLDVVFIGDSITEQRQGTLMGKPVEEFTGIKEVFEKTFTKDKGGDFSGIAMGIAGDTAPNLLWRLINGEMPYGLTPKVWWVGIGINDLTVKACSEEVVLLGILRVVEEIQNRHPDDIVVINSLLPVKRNVDGLLEHFGKHHEDVALKKKEKNLLNDEMSKKRMHIDIWPSIVSINKELKSFASNHKKIKFFNADNVFVDERLGGKYLKLDLMMDPVHPSLDGHKKWNNAIKKYLREILKDRN